MCAWQDCKIVMDQWLLYASVPLVLEYNCLVKVILSLSHQGEKELFNSRIHCLRGATPKELHLKNFTYKASFTPGPHADYCILDLPHAVIAWDLRVLEGGEFILHVGEMDIHGAERRTRIDFNNNAPHPQWIKPPSIQILIFSPSSWLWGWLYDFWPMIYQQTWC